MSGSYKSLSSKESEQLPQHFGVDVRRSGGSFKAQLTINGQPVAVNELRRRAKTAVIEMLLRRLESEAETAWEIALGNDL
jgi:hypothetical protein